MNDENTDSQSECSRLKELEHLTLKDCYNAFNILVRQIYTFFSNMNV